MDPIDSLFLKVREASNAQERSKLLAEIAVSNPAVVPQLESLLREAEKADDFFEANTIVPPHGVAMHEGEGSTIGGKYKLLQKIGEGGMGVVYMAEQQQPVVRKVALKIIKLGMDTKQVVARFEAERQALAMMDHSNIARVLDAGATENGRPYFVMELVQGLPFTKFCDEQKCSMLDRLKLILDVCSAVQHAHQKGIIHRDLKPSNILVTLHGDQPVPKVIDFGIAKATQQRLTGKTLFTEFQQFLGTPAYMSPEQASLSGLDIDTRSDIYSLGVLIYELLTGKTPFDPNDLLRAGFEEMRKTITEKEPVRPSTLLHTMGSSDLTATAKRRQMDVPRLIHSVKGDLDWIVMKCLEKDRSRRYETVNGLMQDLRRHLQNEPVLARPPSAAYRLQKLARRHRGTFMALAAVLLAISGGAILSTFLYFREVKAHQRALAAEREQAALREESLKAHRAESVQRQRAEDVLHKMELQRAEELLSARNTVDGLAALARALRENPTNRVAADRLMSALNERAFAVPLGEPLQHEGWTVAGQFSQNGKLIVTGSRDGTARVWDAFTGRPVTPPLHHEQAVFHTEFSPDGSKVVTASWDGTVGVWDATTGKRIFVAPRHEGRAIAATFSPDGRSIAEGGNDGIVRIWDHQSGRALTPDLEHSASVRSVVFSPDGQRLLTASDDQTARVWNVKDGSEALKPLRHEGQVIDARFSPDGKTIATASHDAKGRLWDSTTGQQFGLPLQHDGSIKHVSFSPDGTLVATASPDHTARIWDAKTGRMTIPPLRHNMGVFNAVFSPDGKLLLSVGDDSMGRIWEVETGRPAVEPFDTDGWVFNTGFSPDGRRVFTAGWSTAARIWEIHGRSEKSVLALDQPNLRRVEYRNDGKQIVVVGLHSHAFIWNSPFQSAEPMILPHKKRVLSAHFRSDNEAVVTASEDHTATVWNPNTGERLFPALKHDKTVNAARFSPDNKWVVTASSDGIATLWDAKTGRSILKLEHGVGVREAMFTPDSSKVLTVADDDQARVWEVESGALIGKPMPHYPNLACLVISPDGTKVATGALQTTRIWELASGKLLRDLGVHSKATTSVSGLDFSPDGRRLATASYDRTARLWDVETGESVGDLLYHSSAVYSVEFSKEGDRLLTSSHDGTVRVWDTATTRPLSEPFRSDGAASWARFSPNGETIVCVGLDRGVWFWKSPRFPVPVPAWLPELAEAIAGRRVDDRHTPVSVAPTAVQEMKEKLLKNRSSDPYTKWAHGFFGYPER